MESGTRCKVLQFITALSDGGAETLVKDYACLLDKEKFEVKVVPVHNVVDTANYRRAKEDQVSILPIYSTYNLATRTFNKLFGTWYIPYRLKQIIAQEKPDCIHVHLSLLRHLKKISKHIKDVKILYTCHSIPHLFFEGQNRIEGNAARYLIKHHDFQLIALHREMADAINQMFNVNNAAIIRNGCDFLRFQTVNETKESIRRKLGIPEDAFVIGHVGRFSKEKNHAYLIDVFCQLKKQNPKAYLLMIGSGDLRRKVEEKLLSLGLAEEAMILSHRTDIPFLLKAMDVFVFPSLHEGLSVTLVEAQAAHLRCVISDCINEENILSENTVAVSLSEPVEKWCEAISSPELLSKVYGKLEDYDMRNSIKDLEKLYHSKRM